MIISLETKYPTLQKICEPPIIGPIFIFLIAVAPIPLLFILNGIFHFTTNEYIEQINALVTGIWNVALTFGFRIKIKLFFIPCWILFLLIGTLRYFHIIG